MEDDDDEYDGDSGDFHSVDLFFIGPFSALSSAYFTLSRVHTLWYLVVGDDEVVFAIDNDETNFSSKSLSSKRFSFILEGDGGKFKSWSFATVWLVCCLRSDDDEGEGEGEGETEFDELHLCK